MEEQAEGGPEVRAWPRCERLVVAAGTSGRRRCGCGDMAARVARCDPPCPCGPLRPAKTRHSPRQPCGAARGAGRGGRGRGFRPRGGVWGGTRRPRPRASGASGQGSASGGFRGARSPGAGGAGAGAPPLGEDALCATIGSCQPPRGRLCSSQPRFPHRRRGQSPLRYLPPGILVGIEAMSPFRAGTFTAIQTCSATAWDSQAPGSPTLVVGSKVTMKSPFPQRQVGQPGGALPCPACCTSDWSGAGVALTWG